MKKFLLLAFAMIAFAVTSASAQTVENSQFFDNWSLGLKGGGVTPLKGEGTMRGVVGLELQKNITPVWGLGVEGQWTVNTSGWDRFMHSTTAFDHQLLGVYSTINLMNLFGGYKGTPRVFEINVNAGVGWLHAYMNNHKELYDLLGASSFNSWYAKVGPDFNFNLGKTKVWSLSLKPAFVYNMNYPGSTGYDVRHGYFEILAGVTYHFKNKNKTHSFKIHDDSELLCDLACLQKENKSLVERIEYLENNPLIVEKVIQVTNDVAEVDPVIEICISSVVGFDFAESIIDDKQFANLQNVAEIIKNDPNLKVDILGYASAAEGTAEVNMKLSQERANAVKDALVKTFNVNPNQLNAIGKGITSQPWEQNAWNRAVEFQVVK